jgi:hypothetical protein
MLEKYWASIPKVVGSIPTVTCPVWIYTQRNITNIIFDDVTRGSLSSKIIDLSSIPTIVTVSLIKLPIFIRNPDLSGEGA